MLRGASPLREAASNVCPAALNAHHLGRSKRLDRKRVKGLPAKCRGLNVSAVLQQDRYRSEKSVQADAASRPELRHQVSASTAAADTYISVNEAQDVVNGVVDANSLTPPVVLRFCESGQQVCILPFNMPQMQCHMPGASEYNPGRHCIQSRKSLYLLNHASVFQLCSTDVFFNVYHLSAGD